MTHWLLLAVALSVPPEALRLTERAHAALVDHRDVEALQLYEQAFARGDKRMDSAYDAACAAARLAQRDQAFAWLQRALEAGLQRADWVEQEEAFASLRADPRFAKAVAAVRAAAERADRDVKLPALRDELLRLSEEDQAARKAVVRSQWKDQAALQRMRESDARTTARLKQVIDAHGWPGRTLVGERGANAAWLFAQHADEDPAFQARCLKLLEPAVQRGEADGEQLALLTDRVLLAQGKPQRYGSQFERKGERWVPKPIEDEAHVDERRRAVGLWPLADYARQIEESNRKR
jgi:hypothetical protein